MNINTTYIVAIVVSIIVLFTLIFNDSPEQIQNTSEIKLPETKEQIKPQENTYEDVEISYSNQKKDLTKKEKKNTETKTTKTPIVKEDKTKIYELISTGSNIDGYEINVASSSPIPKRNPSAFPQIPATVQGSIDGKKFSLVIPSDLGVKDFKVKIKNQETGEIRFVELTEDNVKAGSSSVLNIDTNNFENIELRSNSYQVPPMPPIPIPRF